MKNLDKDSIIDTLCYVALVVAIAGVIFYCVSLA